MDTEPPLSLGGGGDGSQPGTGPSSVASSRSGYNSAGANNIHNMLLLQNEQAVVRKAGRYAIRQFLDSHTCFAVLRTSGKVVVFDTRIPIQLAFYALVEHDILAAPLWDPMKCQFVGLLTVTDFIDILRYYRSCLKDVSTLAVSSIAEILQYLETEQQPTTLESSSDAQQQQPNNDGGGVNDIIGGAAATATASSGSTVASSSGGAATAGGGATPTTTGSTASNSVDESSNVAVVAPTNSNKNTMNKRIMMPIARSFLGADSSCTLRQACEQLLSSTSDNHNATGEMTTASPNQQQNYHQDFLPIVFAEDMRVLACITFTTILEHLVTHFREQRRLFDDSIIDLGIGTYTNVISIYPQQTLADALELMYQYNLSALPVVESTPNGKKKLIGVYSRSDITFLTKAMDAEDAVRNLDMSVGDILLQSRMDVTTPDALRTCSPSHTLQAIFESFAQLRFNRLYVVDPSDDTLLGTVSARDLVSYFLRTDPPTENTSSMEQ